MSLLTYPATAGPAFRRNIWYKSKDGTNSKMGHKPTEVVHTVNTLSGKVMPFAEPPITESFHQLTTDSFVILESIHRAPYRLVPSTADHRSNRPLSYNSYYFIISKQFINTPKHTFYRHYSPKHFLDTCPLS